MNFNRLFRTGYTNNIRLYLFSQWRQRRMEMVFLRDVIAREREREREMSHAIFTKIPPVVFKIIRCFPFFFVYNFPSCLVSSSQDKQRSN